MLKVTVLFCQFDLSMVLAMYIHSELEQVDTFSALYHLIVELCSDEGPLYIVRVFSPAVWLFVTKEEHVQVVIGFRSAIF